MGRFSRCGLCLVVSAFLLCLGVRAAPAVSANAWVLMEADSGRVLLGQNETAERSIASTTKIMTAVVALERCRPTDLVTVKREQLREGSSMYLAEGEQVTMEALLYGLMLPSGNDAAECIAASCGLSREEFIRRMNEKAAELGMAHTAFANPSGLDEAGHHSCALDMARLMAYAMENPTFTRIVSTRTASVGKRSMSNHNKLLSSVEGCIGGKTGYTTDAGRTLVTCAERNGLRLVAVTLHDGSDWKDHQALYDYGFSTVRRETLEATALCVVRGGESPVVALRPASGLSYPVQGEEKLTLRLETEPYAPAPVRQGLALGQAVLLLDGEEVRRVPLLAEETVRAAQARQTRRHWWG